MIHWSDMRVAHVDSEDGFYLIYFGYFKKL